MILFSTIPHPPLNEIEGSEVCEVNVPVHPKGVHCSWGQGSVQDTTVFPLTANHVFMKLAWWLYSV